MHAVLGAPVRPYPVTDILPDLVRKRLWSAAVRFCPFKSNSQESAVGWWGEGFMHTLNIAGYCRFNGTL